MNGKVMDKPNTPIHEKDVVNVDENALKAFVDSLSGSLTQDKAVKEVPILYEAKGFLVFNKPPFMRTETLVNGLLPVHRLDKDTSGLLVAAKNIKTQAALQKQWHDRKVTKTYLTLIKGVLSPAKGSIEAGIARSSKDRRKMAVSSSVKSRNAVTNYEVISYIDEPFSGEKFTLVNAFPKTGRTHQIRVHFASIHHPVVGDAVYGDKAINNIFAKKYGLKRQFLHAEKLELINPSTKKNAVFNAKTPDDLAEVLKRIERF